MIKMNLKKVILATRPWSFPASVMPVLIGLAYVYFQHSVTGVPVKWWALPLVLFSAIAFHAAGNMISDYHDAKTGVDKLESFGDTNMMLNKTFSEKAFLSLGLVWLSLAILSGNCLMWFSSWKLLFFGLFGMACTFLYYKMKYSGWGDVVIFFAFGFAIVNGTVFALSGILNIQSICISIPVSLLTTAILHANNTRDVPLDKEAGIKTFSMILGLRRAKIYYILLVLGAYVLEMVMIGMGFLPVWLLLVVISLPLALKNIHLIRRIRHESLEEMAHLDVSTAQLTTAFSILAIIGFILA